MTAATTTETRFTASLDEQDVGWSRIDAADLPEELAEWDEPVVGAPFHFDDLSLPDGVPKPTDPETVREATTGITSATLAIADYGSVLIESNPPGAELVSLYVDTHVAVVRRADIVDSMGEAFAELGPRIRDGRGNAIVATGPSATADMGALVRGVHGPGEVHVVIVE